MKSLSTTNDSIKSLSNKFDKVLSSRTINRIKDLECDNRYMVSTKATRLDMISQELYGSYEYDWILALVNGLTSPEVIKGVTLKYPTKDKIMEFLTKYEN